MSKGSFVDVSERSVVSLTGPDCLEFVQRISTNDVSSLTSGQTIQTVFTTEKGRIVEVPTVHRQDDVTLLLLGQEAQPTSLISWLEKYIIMEDIKTNDITSSSLQYLLYDGDVSDYALLSAILPPGCLAAFESFGGANLLRVLSPPESMELTERVLTTAGFLRRRKRDFDEFRVLNGIPGGGTELTGQYNPLEANLSSLIGWTKGCYIGQEVIARLDTYKKVQRRLVKLALAGLPAGLPAAFFHGDLEAGIVTSAMRLGSTGDNKGLGYIKIAEDGQDEYFYLKEGVKVSLQVVAN